MPSLKDVKNKIAGVRKTKQITKAMNMVSSSKLRGAQAGIERFRPYAEKFYDMLSDVAAKADTTGHVLLEARENVQKCLIVLETSDRGLCGSFNANLINAGLRLAREKRAEGKTVQFICVGKKGRDAIKKSDYEVVLSYAERLSNIDFSLANEIGLDLIYRYVSQQTDEVFLLYGEFQSRMKQIPTVLPLLPLSPQTSEDTGPQELEYVYEPAVETLLAELLPRFVKVQIYRSLLDTSASEHAARMTAMDNATRNCDDMTSALTLLYNKTRQASITSDLIDIVGGAEALKG